MSIQKISFFHRLVLPTAAIVVALAGMINTKPALAAWPEKPITILFPWVASHPGSAFLRILGKHASKQLGQPVVVSSVTGAGGKKSMIAGAKAAPDGYTLTNNWVAPHVAGKLFDPKLPYDSSSFVSIAGLTAIPFTATVAATHKANSLSEFIAMAKKKGGKLNFGVCAGQSVPRLVGEQMMRSAGLSFVSIPNNSGCVGDNMTGLLNGSLDISVGIVPATRILSGKVKHLALISDFPHPAAPKLATVKSQGAPIGWGNAALGWAGLVAPKNTPADVVAKLRKVVSDTMNDKAFVKDLGKTAGMMKFVPHAEFEKLWGESFKLLAPHVATLKKKK